MFINSKFFIPALLLTLLSFVLIILNAGWANPELEKIPLPEAIAKKWVEARFTGINDAPQQGRVAGESIMFLVRNVSQKPLELTIPQGMVLQADVRGLPDMVVMRVAGTPVGLKEITPVSQIILEDSNPREYVLEAYSLDFDQNPPTFSDSFTLNREVALPIQQLLEILPQLPAEKRSKEAIQVAIWKLTNSESEQNFQAKVEFPVTEKDLVDAEFILAQAGLKNVQVVDYKRKIVLEGSIFCMLFTANNDLTTEPGPCPGGEHFHMLKTQDGEVITLITSKKVTNQISELTQEQKAHAFVIGRPLGRHIFDPEEVKHAEKN